MEIPRFEKQNVNPKLAPADLGDAFQGFVHELLLPEHPGLHRFPGGGKDGGIDLIETQHVCFVVECKVVGEDDYGKVEQRWRLVEKHLEEHLRNPIGPTKGQSQYGPWYSTDTPITQYLFCVSAALTNEDQRRRLQKVIEEFFHNLARERSHLSHLSSLKVSIEEWNQLSGRLRQRPHLMFRWFPSTRPNGLVPLDEAVDVGTFRAYLTNAKLPYYSLAEHLQISPAPIGILDEESLLARFENSEITGLVITGKGGIGKSRLTLELGWLALQKGWVAMRVQSRVKENALEDLAERLTSGTRALLLVDYIETQNDFGELVENMNLLSDSGIANIRYIAACRTGYYYHAIAASSRHLPVDLTPPPGAATLDWFADYRGQIVERILAKAGLPVSQQHLAVCRDLPILAVFLAYLHTSGRNDDLAELLTEIEFGRWVAKRIQLSFQSKDISRDLALLVPLFPIDQGVAAQIGYDLRSIFDRLATDGWIEKLPANAPESFDTWVTAHDVLADQILLSYLRGIPNTTDLFVAELFSLAASLGCLSSAIVSLQRIADSPPLNAVHWVRHITDALTINESAWRNVRDLLVRTSLLSAPDRIALLQGHETFWADVEKDIIFQNSLGWFARWAALGTEGSGTQQAKEILLPWISKAIPFVEKNNFLLTWGLRLAPELVREAALRWISTRPLLFQTHYLMVAWLELSLSPQRVAVSVQRWCEKFSRILHLSFLAPAWLKAGGDKALVEDSIKEWLGHHKTDPEARFVYQAWLDAGGDKALVEDSIREWLGTHQTDAEAQFVYQAWLDARGDKALVEDSIRKWLGTHQTDAEASHVYKAWLDAGGDKTLVEESIRGWLGTHQTDAEASHVYQAWLDAGGDKALVEESIRGWLGPHQTDAEASHVYQAWLDAGGDKALVEESIREWLGTHQTDAEASHVYKAWLDADWDKALVEESIREWLSTHQTDENADFVFNAWLDAGGDKALVEESIREWLGTHQTDAEASHVYKAWLDSGGDKALVQHGLEAWLAEHREDADADHLFRAWFEAGGERELVWDAALAWLAKHRIEESAVYMTKFIAKQRDLPMPAVRNVLEWCRTFPGHEDALWRLTQLGMNLFVAGVEADVVLTAEAVLADSLAPMRLPQNVTRGQVAKLFSYLFESSQMQAGSLRERVDSMFLKWLRHPQSFGNDPKAFRHIQRPAFVQRLLAAIADGAIDPEKDTQHLMRFMRWLNTWDAENKERVAPMLDELKRNYPAPEVWDIVRFDE